MTYLPAPSSNLGLFFLPLTGQKDFLYLCFLAQSDGGGSSGTVCELGRNKDTES